MCYKCHFKNNFSFPINCFSRFARVGLLSEIDRITFGLFDIVQFLLNPECPLVECDVHVSQSEPPYVNKHKFLEA